MKISLLTLLLFALSSVSMATDEAAVDQSKQDTTEMTTASGGVPQSPLVLKKGEKEPEPQGISWEDCPTCCPCEYGGGTYLYTRNLGGQAVCYYRSNYVFPGPASNCGGWGLTDPEASDSDK